VEVYRQLHVYSAKNIDISKQEICNNKNNNNNNDKNNTVLIYWCSTLRLQIAKYKDKKK
jgi:effector-binding domain-containing protein